MVGYTYNPWLTRTRQTSFPWTWKAAPPPPRPPQDPFHFSSLSPTRILPPDTRAISAPPCKQKNSALPEKLWFLKWKKWLSTVGTVRPDLGPRDSSGAGPSEHPNIFSSVGGVFSTLTFSHLDLTVSFFPKDSDVCERSEENSLRSFVCLCELG